MAGDFDKEFDDKQSFLRLCLIIKWHLSLSLQVCSPCCIGNRAFLVAK
jgi:hypothetical protein